MKLINRLKMAVLFALVLALAVPFSASAAEEQLKYPESIAGYPVIFVKTPENSIELATGEVVLVLLDSTPRFEREKEPPSRQAVGIYLRDNKLPEGWTIEVVGGPGVTKEQFERLHAESQARLREQYDRTPQGSAEVEAIGKTYAIVRNNDALLYTVDYLSAVIYAAPWVGPYNNQSWMLVNGMTNYNYFLQAGQRYLQNGYAYNMWTDTDVGLQPQEFYLVPYIEYDTFEFEVGLSFSTWFVAATNLDNGNHQSRYRRSTATGGTRFIFTTDTSVFFENANSNANWWYYFDPNPIRVRWAAERRDGQYSAWQYQDIIIFDSKGRMQPNNGIITGSLLNFGSAYWHLDKVLIVE